MPNTKPALPETIHSPRLLKQAITHLKDADPVMREIIERVGPVPMPQRPNRVDTLILTIANQQLSGVAARTIYKRVQALNGERELTAAALGKMTDEQIRAAGMSFGKIRTIRALCDAIKRRKLNLKKLEQLSDSEVLHAITAVKGLGPWTAQMYLMFVLGRPDIFAPGDGGIQKAIRTFYRTKSPKRVAGITAKWKPYRTVACVYLWRGLG